MPQQHQRQHAHRVRSHHSIIAAITPIALPGAAARYLEPNLGRQIKDGGFDIFPFDATACLGNSGSPLFGADSGAVSGVISMVLMKDTKNRR